MNDTPKKSKKEKPTPIRCIEIANEMCERWSDEHLMSRHYEDLMKAYGLKEREAINMLKMHREKRGLI